MKVIIIHSHKNMYSKQKNIQEEQKQIKVCDK